MPLHDWTDRGCRWCCRLTVGTSVVVDLEQTYTRAAADAYLA